MLPAPGCLSTPTCGAAGSIRTAIRQGKLLLMLHTHALLFVSTCLLAARVCSFPVPSFLTLD